MTFQHDVPHASNNPFFFCPSILEGIFLTVFIIISEQKNCRYKLITNGSSICDDERNDSHKRKRTAMTFSEDASNYVGASCNRNSVFSYSKSVKFPKMEKYVDSN
jgi:hypothetical protein